MEKSDIISKWNEVQEILKYEFDITEISYTGFLENLKPLHVTDEALIIKAEDSMSINIVEKKYLKYIKIAIKEVIGEVSDIIFVTSEKELAKYIGKEEKKASSYKKETNNDLNPNASNLNNKYTFDTFVVGNSNKFASAAALAVAEAPAEAYNPFFIYGGVGLGKTHLMHSIAHFILNENRDAKVLYVSSEKFTNELIQSIREDKNEEFRQKYRNIDVLLVDDIQFIAGKERTQEEFFHTFNTLHEAKKQIIISSDRPPKEIETLEERLRSRFEWGLITDIQPPDFETRMAILRNKADLENLNMEDEVFEMVASHIKSNIRELEGAVNKIVAYSKLVHLSGTTITKKIAEEALKDLILEKEDNIVTPQSILAVVSDYYNVSVSDIVGKKRPREISNPRQIVMYLSRKLTDASLPKIGEILGKRDHTTILHGYEKISSDIEKDPTLRHQIEILTKKITAK